MFKSTGYVAALGAVIVALPFAAKADLVNATLSATYFEVADHSDADFNTFSTPNVLNGSLLGPDGLPVATSPFGVNDVNPATHEITWWSPGLNSNVVQTGTGTINLPFSGNMYAPNSTGTNDSSFFETAIFSGNFTLSSAGTVEFQLGSDDDSFIYVDGILFGQNPGVHGVTNVDFTSPTLDAGAHTIEVLYADRENTGAFLSLNLLSTDVTITTTPLPGALPLFASGLGGLGLFGWRRKRKAQAVAA